MHSLIKASENVSCIEKYKEASRQNHLHIEEPWGAIIKNIPHYY
ncbi:hypothetical protein [Saccharicrinis fermentans]|nr:hypothetical protein [Saccharicrinis fermentans]